MIEKKVALFGGIGRREDIAKDLVSKGWRVAISYRAEGSSKDRIQDLIKELGDDKVLGVVAEISQYEEAEKFVQQTFEKYGRIDALINIASNFPEESERERMGSEGIKEEDWEYYKSNFFVARNTTKALLDLKNNPAKEINIINTSDTNILRYNHWGIIDPYEKFNKDILEVSIDDIKDIGIKQLEEDNADVMSLNPYSLAKRDIGYLTRKLAEKYGNKGVRVNAIAPGPISPPPGKTKEEWKHVLENTLLKDRWGGTEAFIQAINYFLNTKFITGVILPVDAGQDVYNMRSN